MNQVQVPRLEALQSLSDHYGTDPYSLSRKLRKRFREDKKEEKLKEAADDELKGKYGLPETLKLTRDDEATRAKDREEWEKARSEVAARERAKRPRIRSVGLVARASLASGSASSHASSSRKAAGSSAAEMLKARILGNTARRKPPGNIPSK